MYWAPTSGFVNTAQPINDFPAIKLGSAPESTLSWRQTAFDCLTSICPQIFADANQLACAHNADFRLKIQYNQIVCNSSPTYLCDLRFACISFNSATPGPYYEVATLSCQPTDFRYIRITIKIKTKVIKTERYCVLFYTCKFQIVKSLLKRKSDYNGQKHIDVLKANLRDQMCSQ